MRSWFFTIIFLIVVAVAAWWALPFFMQTPIADVHIYGTSVDPMTERTTNLLLPLREKFGNRLRVTVHYLALRDQENHLTSLEVQRNATATTSPELIAYDLEENQRRLVMQEEDRDQFWQYLLFRQGQVLDYGWQSAALQAGFDDSAIDSVVQSRGEELQLREIEQFEARQGNAFTNGGGALPLIFVNGQRYTGPLDTTSVSHAVVKALLRGSRTELPSDPAWNIGPVSLRYPMQYAVHGVAECSRDIHCDDSPTRDGICVAQETPAARCVYTESPNIRLAVIADSTYVQEQDLFLRNILASFKRVTVDLIESEGDVGKQLQQQLTVQRLPSYLFDASIEQDRRFQVMLESGAITKVGEGWYTIRGDR